MAHAFKTISAKPTFGTLKHNLSQSDYIARKKWFAHTYNMPFPDTNVNKSNLIMGQYTKLNLMGICTVAKIEPTVTPSPDASCPTDKPVIIDPNATTDPFYYKYQIDPMGELFGKSQCGELNYIRYMELL